LTYTLKTFIGDTQPDEIKNKVTISGSWIHGSTPGLTSYDYHFKHLKHGVRDLLNEKLFYLSLEPITPSKNLITNGVEP
jgi:hypothetical protein